MFIISSLNDIMLVLKPAKSSVKAWIHFLTNKEITPISEGKDEIWENENGRIYKKYLSNESCIKGFIILYSVNRIQNFRQYQKLC